MTKPTPQTKSKQRVRDHGEVFTNEREVKAMCYLVADECTRIDSRFLEPACGDGNFLAEILTRKLAVVKHKYGRSAMDYEMQSILALSSLYGVDILHDNVLACRLRLFNMWLTAYKTVCKREPSIDMQKSAQFILQLNIVCGNALTLKCVDDNATDTADDIVFSEWAFITGTKLQRKDYTFAYLLAQESDATAQQQTFLTQDDEGILLKQYICDYRRIWQNG